MLIRHNGVMSGMRAGQDCRIPSPGANARPESVAASSFLELRHAITALGIDEAQDLLDELETLIIRHRPQLP